MDKETAEKIWARFIHLLSVDTFGAKEVAEGKLQKSLFGSVALHKAAFDQAVKDVMGA